MSIGTTGGSRPMHLKVMLSGPPKSGKTTLLGTVPNILIADTEPHANNMESLAHLNLPCKTIHGTTDLKDLLMILSNETLRKQAAQSVGLPDIEAVAIDTLDTLQGIMKRERLKENRATQFLRDDWGWLKSEMESIIQAFLSLPMHVFFLVHTKTKDVGTEANPKTVVLPGLEGAIAESIAGMVGYSLLSFRKQEIRPDGTPYTKYWVRAEGDQTYEFLGTRTAGRLPDIIEPDFQTLLAATQAGRQAAVQAAPAAPSPVLQTTGQTAQAPAGGTGAGSAPAAAAPQAQAPDPAPAPVAAPAPAPSSGQPAAPLPADDEPVSAAGIQQLSKLYAQLGQAFPEEKIKALSLGDARGIVRMWRALQADHAEGKSQQDPQVEMLQYLDGMGLSEGAAAPAVEAQAVEPKVDGTIEQVMAYVGDDLVKVQEAYDLESAKDKPRSGLISQLESKGAKVQTPTETPTEAAPEPTNPEPAVADVPPTEEQAVQTATEALGAVQVSQEINADALCEECKKPLDDLDLAELGKTRFGRLLCVEDYIAETKKPATV